VAVAICLWLENKEILKTFYSISYLISISNLISKVLAVSKK